MIRLILSRIVPKWLKNSPTFHKKLTVLNAIYLIKVWAKNMYFDTEEEQFCDVESRDVQLWLRQCIISEARATVGTRIVKFNWRTSLQDIHQWRELWIQNLLWPIGPAWYRILQSDRQSIFKRDTCSKHTMKTYQFSIHKLL